MSLAPLNNSVVNSEPLNGVGSSAPTTPNTNVYGVFNTMLFNALEVNASYTTITINPSEDIADMRQKVCIAIIAPTICSFLQDVQYKTSVATHTIVAIAQSTRTQRSSDNMIRVLQFVVNSNFFG
jgi:hypothetical protein